VEAVSPLLIEQMLVQVPMPEQLVPQVQQVLAVVQELG
jgi:hypothetical protein